MRALIAALSLSLVACATQGPGQDAQAIDAFVSWRDATIAQAREGKIAWSAAYDQIFDRAAKLPPSAPAKALYLEITDGMIRSARAYEEGHASKDDLKDAQRQAGIRWAKEMDRLRAMSAAEQAEYNQRAHAAALQLMLDNNRKPAAQPYQMQPLTPPQTTSCQTVGEQTVCQTR